MKIFNINNLKPGCNILIIGQRGTGKTQLTLDISYNIKKIKLLECITPSSDAYLYENYIKNNCIHEMGNCNVKILEDFYNKSLKMKKENIKDIKNVLIMDNLYDKDLLNDKYFTGIIINGRCINISTILSNQYPLTLKPEIRANMDYLFIFRETNKKNLELLYNNYTKGIFDTLDIFEQTLNEATKENYQCLVIDLISKKNNVFIYKSNLEYINDENFKLI